VRISQGCSAFPWSGLELRIFNQDAHDAIQSLVHVLGSNSFNVLRDKALALGIGAHSLGEPLPDRLFVRSPSDVLMEFA